MARQRARSAASEKEPRWTNARLHVYLEPIDAWTEGGDSYHNTFGSAGRLNDLEAGPRLEFGPLLLSLLFCLLPFRGLPVAGQPVSRTSQSLSLALTLERQSEYVCRSR